MKTVVPIFDNIRDAAEFNRRIIAETDQLVRDGEKAFREAEDVMVKIRRLQEERRNAEKEVVCE